MASSNDPTDMWRNLINQWEKNVDDFANTMMGTDEFSKSANMATQFQLRMQSAFTEQMSKQLEAMNIPSKDDVARLGARLQNIDERMRRMEEAMMLLAKKLDPTADIAQSKIKMPPRTKKPPQKENSESSP